MALDMPMVDSKSILLNGKGGTNPKTITSNNLIRPTAGEPSQSQHHHQQDADPTTSSRSRFMNSVKPSTSPALSPDAMVKAAAFAAGARIATASDAATLLKAAQSKNAVYIIPGGPNSIKSSGPSNVNPLPPNVHYIRTGLVNRSTSGHNITNATRPVGAQQAQSQINRHSLPTARINSTQTANESNSLKEKVHEEVIVVSQNGPKEQVSKSVASVSCNEANENIPDHASVLHNEAKERAQEDRSVLHGSATHLQSEDNNVENPRCLSPTKVVGKTDLTSIGAGSGSEKWEENEMIEKQVEKEKTN